MAPVCSYHRGRVHLTFDSAQYITDQNMMVSDDGSQVLAGTFSGKYVVL